MFLLEQGMLQHISLKGMTSVSNANIRHARLNLLEALRRSNKLLISGFYKSFTKEAFKKLDELCKVSQKTSRKQF